MSNLYWLTEAQIERLKLFVPKSHGKPRVDDRSVLSGEFTRLTLSTKNASRPQRETRTFGELQEGPPISPTKRRSSEAASRDLPHP